MKIIHTEADIQEGIACLADADPRLMPMIALAGPIPLRRSQPGFAGLCSIIISQQLSVASAAAIRTRTQSRLGALDPTVIRQASDEDLRACGLSTPKLRTLRAIADAAHAGTLDLDALPTMTPDAVERHLTAIKGIGPWTSDIYRMFYIGEADAFAAGDLALQEALKIGFALEKRPNASELADFAETWRPWRAVAARLLWAYYRVVKTREGIG